ncbi:MAG: helix-turn-helix domain-containing protein [Lachnospiraceae bacterium]|nr:helix-turn-helix domain-containing protein [Lachnospiraceae bacterium]
MDDSVKGKYNFSEKVIEEACKGDTEALTIILEHYEGYIRRKLRTMSQYYLHLNLNIQDEEDLVQNVMISIIKTIGKFKMNK